MTVESNSGLAGPVAVVSEQDDCKKLQYNDLNRGHPNINDKSLVTFTTKASDFDGSLVWG